ncbi:uncharacterized protein LOC129573463 [Sitodiplosis mosellana]|uniref:uncharacterized protein LOC129573463 n=1 Tax=Sitodiplosis mosellana TaxID=263140 RepID=UPI0024447808|nr:uncharacterized protein LOC129573463 [Sitodiplosis mosellana]
MGSEVNLITKRTVCVANLPKKKFSIQIEGVTGIEVASHIALIKISPWYEKSDENCLYKTCVVLKKLPVAQRIECSADIPEFQSIIKADPNFNKAGFADILLGIDTWAEIIMDRVLRSSTGLCAQLTKFGYAIFGAINSTPRFTASVLCIGRAVMSGEESHRLDELLQKFWENEEIPSVEQILSESEQRAIDHYNKNTVRAENGQFIVRLPFIDDKVDLGESREIALQRFYQLERRLERNQELRQKYNISMHEAIELGHMRLATAEERHASGYYIPHHPITTRFRIVKDGSCATTNGKSINDVQLAGPNLQEKLAHVIMRFRFHQFVLSADVKQMFLQIQMNDEDLKYQKIFWRFNKQDPLQEYVWKTVLFGMKSSPFLAIYTVLELARIYENEFPSASRAAKSERYMDDFMSGADSLQAVIKLYDELKQLMAKGKFDLSKWKTNSPKLLELINKDYNTDNQPLELNDDPTSVLGLKWQPNSDCFMFSTKVQHELNKTVTKRTVSSAVARIFDPIGYLAPIMIKGKAFLQRSWKLNLKWDEPLPDKLKDEQGNETKSFLREDWLEFCATLSAINDIRIIRWIQTTRGREIELIGFCDASKIGYGAEIYVRCSSGTNVWCNLLTAKTKVAPVKELTIPRLELCAAELLAKLLNVVRKKCELEYVPYELYSDSTIDLSWIRNCPSKLKIFVATRVQTIQNITAKEQWFYVPTKQSPADIASRGMLASELVNCNLWWHGPQFIFQCRENRERFQPNFTSEEQEMIQSEYRPKVTNIITIRPPQVMSINNISLIERFSKLAKIVRITAYVFKAISLIKERWRNRKNGNSNEASTRAETIGLLSNCKRFGITFTV